MAIVMADLDHFKVLNDTYGHDTGDRALRLFARVLRDSLRTSDLVCRYGGEEFAIAFPDCAASDAMHAIESVRVQLDAAITVAGLPKFTASYGVTDKEPGEQLESALRRSDDALMAAKRDGRDKVVHHDAGIAPTTGPVITGSDSAGDSAMTNGHDGIGIRRRNGISHTPLVVEDVALAPPESR
jgi:diguanylate cyclase (GGDEF)-like protein